MKNNFLLIAVITTVVGVGGFFAGMKYQQSRRPSVTDFQSMRGSMRQDPSGTRPSGIGAIRGEIIDKDEESITVKLPDGSSKIVLISGNTQINKATEAMVDDLLMGEQVMVLGQENSDGSVSASQVQLNFGIGVGRDQ